VKTRKVPNRYIIHFLFPRSEETRGENSDDLLFKVAELKAMTEEEVRA
jgi:hypothetical protein